MRVRVHFNLHRKDFSVINPSTGRVIGNVGFIALAGVEFRVSEHARQKVLRSKVRSVHAYAVGTMCCGPGTLDGLTAVTYNPYRAGHFHIKDHPDQPIRKADVVVFSSGYCWIKL